MIYSGTIDYPKRIDRKHLYEGYSEDDIVKQLIIENPDKLIIVSAVGALNPRLKIGDIVMVKDLVTLFYQSDTNSREFTDLSEPFDINLMDKVHLPLMTHVYMRGPRYETFSDKKILTNLGCDIVGMSMLPEVIACNRLKIPCVGICLVTNLAFEKHDHKYVLEESKKAEDKLKEIIWILDQ